MLKRTVTEIDSKTVLITTEQESPRYVPSIVCADWECEFALESIHESTLIWIPKRSDYSNLSNYELDEDELTGDLKEDLALFQSKIGDDYEAYVLGAYIHSGTSFSVSKSGDHRCRFDSSQLGFLGIKKSSSMTPETVAKALTSIWEGEFYEYQVYDELREEIVDSICTDDYKEAKDFCSEMKERYGVDFDDVKVEY